MQKIALGMGFNEDGTRPVDKSRIIRNLEENEIGKLERHRAIPFYQKDSNLIEFIYMENEL